MTARKQAYPPPHVGKETLLIGGKEPRLRALCVDPNDLDALLLREVAEAQGSQVQVLHAPDAATARAMVAAGPPALILVSPYVRDANWAALVTELSSVSGAEVWVWGGSGLPAEGQRALAAGARQCCSKPKDFGGYAELLGQMLRAVALGG